MTWSDRFRRLDDRVLGPPRPQQGRGQLSPASLGWAAVAFIGSMLTRTPWGLALFIGLGFVGITAVALIRARHTISTTAIGTDAPVTADRSDPVLAWLSRRSERSRALLVWAARFPFIAAPAIGAAAGFGVSNQRGCVQWRGSGACAFYVPGHHTVVGGAAWGFAIGVLVYGAALLIRQTLTRAAAADSAAVNPAPAEPLSTGPAHDAVDEDEFPLVTSHRGRRQP